MPAHKKHGMFGTPIYGIWSGMHRRCRTKSGKDYAAYGGRGITICERWYAFENFYADMGDRPSKLHSLDRIDGTRGYSPENCRWATHAEQNNHRVDNLLITWNGRTLTLREWHGELKPDISYYGLWARHKKGWRGDRLFSPAIPNDGSRRPPKSK